MPLLEAEHLIGISPRAADVEHHLLEAHGRGAQSDLSSLPCDYVLREQRQSQLGIVEELPFVELPIAEQLEVPQIKPIENHLPYKPVQRSSFILLDKLYVQVKVPGRGLVETTSLCGCQMALVTRPRCHTPHTDTRLLTAPEQGPIAAHQ